MTTTDPRPLVRIDDLSVRYAAYGDEVLALDGVSFDIHAGERVAVIGESGSGKSTLTQALLGILAPNGHAEAASAVLDGVDILGGLTDKQWNELRRNRVAYVPQDPNIALNPVRTIGNQLVEAIRLSRGKVERLLLREGALELLTRVGLTDPDRVFASYPHQVSGGQRQRVLIAIALAGEPHIVSADEPTSGLDVTVQKVVLDALDALVADTGVALLLVTHDLGVAHERSDRLYVLQEGRVVEHGPTREVTAAPVHPYTRRLLDSVPSLHAGKRSATVGIPAHPASTDDVEGLVVGEIRKTYVTRDARRGRLVTEAVQGVSLAIPPGTTYGLVGESGSGKSTIARIVAGIDQADSGTVHFAGEDITRLRGRRRRDLHTRIQYVFQNPYTSLDPRLTVFDVVAEPLRGFKVASGAVLEQRVREAVDAVGLAQAHLARRPPELSGGQRQRVAIARATVLRPELIVLDEPVSALDVSVQSQILQLLIDLQHEFGAAYLFISHDLAVIRELSDAVGVLREGVLVEEGDVETVFRHPRHDYTIRLLDSIPALR